MSQEKSFVRYLTLTICILLFASCTKEPRKEYSITAGAHDLRVSLSPGWQLRKGKFLRIAEGEQILSKDGRVIVSFRDYGIFDNAAFYRILSRASELVRNGEVPESRNLLSRLEFTRVLPTKKDQSYFRSHWYTINNVKSTVSFSELADVEKAYDELLEHVEDFPQNTLEDFAKEILQSQSLHRMREIASVKELTLDSHPAILVETWDRLSHSMNLRHLFISNNDNILEISPRLADFATVKKTLNLIIESIKIIDSAAQTP